MCKFRKTFIGRDLKPSPYFLHTNNSHKEIDTIIQNQGLHFSYLYLFYTVFCTINVSHSFGSETSGIFFYIKSNGGRLKTFLFRTLKELKECKIVNNRR